MTFNGQLFRARAARKGCETLIMTFTVTFSSDFSEKGLKPQRRKDGAMLGRSH